MRDIVGLIAIAMFWFILASILTYVSADTTLQDVQAGFEGNTSTLITADTSTLNVSDIDVGSSGSISFIGMFGRMLTFRIPQNTSFPEPMIRFIEIFNFILVVVFGLLLYRQVRSGSG